MFKNKILKFTTLGILSVFLLYSIVCYFSPKTFYVSNSVQIKCSKGLAFIMLNDVREWQKWISWKNNDSNLKLSLGGRYTNIGASFTFDGPTFGKGYVKLDEAFKDSILVSYIKNSKWPSEVTTYWQIIPESKTNLNLNTNSRLQDKIPFFKRPFYSSLEEDFQKMHKADLDSLKSHIENLINTEFGLSSTIFASKKFIGIETPIPNYKMQKYYAENYPKIYKLLDSLKISPAGAPVGMIFDWDGVNSIVDLMAAIPVNEKIDPPLGFEFVEIPNTPCIKLAHYGFYNTLKNAHAKLDFIMNSSSFTLQSPIIEEYVTSPSQEPDTSKWLTNIYYLLETSGSYSKTVRKKYTLEEVVNEQEKARKKKLGLLK
ncbi:MAG: GyrI-like domain-containing protein [Saprospiraceae bacterium]